MTYATRLIAAIEDMQDAMLDISHKHDLSPVEFYFLLDTLAHCVVHVLMSEMAMKQRVKVPKE